jgi:hypothetical protein
MSEKMPNALRTLLDGDIASKRSVSRRSLLSGFGISVGLAAAGIVANVGAARAQRRQEPGPGGGRCTDNDSGRNEDPVGMGRQCRNLRYTGCTDRDNGPNEDPPGYGTGCWV